MQMV